MSLIGDISRYIENYDKGYLPVEESFRHKIFWPIAQEETNFALGNVHEENYSTPSGSVEFHTGIDLHCFLGTPVVAPENSYLLLALKDSRSCRQKVDLFLQGQETRIIYSLCHLDFKSLPKRIKEVSGPGKYRNLPIKERELLGTIGEWHLHISDYPNHNHLLAKSFDNKCDHLHLSASLPTEEDFKRQRIFSGTDEFNPLLILTELKI